MKKGQIYNSRFDELGIERVIQKEDRTSVFAQYTIMLDDRETIMKKLSKINCPTTIHYPKPINEQPVYKNLQQKEYGTPIASSMSDRVLSIPISAYLAALDQERILEVFEK